MAIKITGLTAGVAIEDTDIFESSQSVTTTPVSRKTTALQIKDYMGGQSLGPTDDVQFNSVNTVSIETNVITETTPGNGVVMGSALGLWPRTTIQRNALIPSAGWMVFDTDLSQAFLYNGSSWVIMG